MNKPRHPYQVERYERQRWHRRHKAPILTKILIAGAIATAAYLVSWATCTVGTEPVAKEETSHGR